MVYSNNKTMFGTGCYSISDLGTDKAPGEICYEYGVKQGNSWKITKVECGSALVMSPNGWFHRATLSEDLDSKPKDDYKDSLWIGYGKCETISKINGATLALTHDVCAVREHSVLH